MPDTPPKPVGIPPAAVLRVPPKLLAAGEKLEPIDRAPKAPLLWACATSAVLDTSTIASAAIIAAPIFRRIPRTPETGPLEPW
jgi:hypothetical protein